MENDQNKNTAYENSGANQDSVQYEKNNLESDRRLNNRNSDDSNPLYNADDDFEEDSDMDDADLEDSDLDDFDSEEKDTNENDKYNA